MVHLKQSSHSHRVKVLGDEECLVVTSSLKVLRPKGAKRKAILLETK